jgi:hypothetical protein
MTDMYLPRRRKWTNPELVIFDSGLRLEKLKQHKINLIMALLKVSFSEVGFAKIKDSIKTNEFLGEICKARAILNKHSYLYVLYCSRTRLQHCS